MNLFDNTTVYILDNIPFQSVQLFCIYMYIYSRQYFVCLAVFETNLYILDNILSVQLF